MIVCLCEGVSERQITSVIEGGAQTVEAIGSACGAGTGCGTCHEALETMIQLRGPNDMPCGAPLRACTLAPARAG